MNKLLFSAAFFAMGMTASAAAIEQVIVRQQWPWSTDVKVEYKLSGVTSPVDLSIKAYNGEVELPLPSFAVRGERYGISEDGVGQLVIDPVAAFGTARIALANFKVKLTVSDSPDNVYEVIYKIFRLSDGACEDVTRADLLNGKKEGRVEVDYSRVGVGFSTGLSDVLIWTGVTNNPAYRTTHLVMRKVPAAAVTTWKIGSPSDEWGRQPNGVSEAQHDVHLTQDFFISVFETTMAQYSQVSPKVPLTDDMHPQNQISYKAIRDNSGSGLWPADKHAIGNSENAFLRRLRNRCNDIEFDLPTEAQWEFACRAGTTGGLNNGKPFTKESEFLDGIKDIAWLNTDTAGLTMPVGQKLPNAYGLYDMLGNVNEWCLDWLVDDIDVGGKGDPLTDPEGGLEANASSQRSVRGGAASTDFKIRCSRSAYRYGVAYSNERDSVGFRVVMPATVSGKW